MNKISIIATVFFAFLLSQGLVAQNDSVPLISTLRLEVRADLQYHHLFTNSSVMPLTHDDNTYGFTGRYFNLHMGGNLTHNLSYYFRQRIIANPGSASLFDNTDFLYIDYKFAPRWSVRVGKEALAVGGFEYDAPPIDVLFWSYYWDNFYCFQLAAGVKYQSLDHKNTIVAQVANSPYLHYTSPFKNSLLSFNLLWNGQFGPFQTLYSFNMFQRNKEGQFMNYIALGNKLAFKKWDVYVDFIHRATSPQNLMKDFGVVARLNVKVHKDISMFFKGGYEQNMDMDEFDNYMATGEIWDCLALPGQRYTYGGLGIEYRPRRAPDVRIHAFVADAFTHSLSEERTPYADVFGDYYVAHHDLTANVGITWNIDILRYLNRRVR